MYHPSGSELVGIDYWITRGSVLKFRKITVQHSQKIINPAHGIFIGKPQRKRPICRPRLRRGAKIKWILKNSTGTGLESE
jgi:hypothetical protein